MDEHYAAFISYRHHELDSAVAREVEHQLEHYHIPRSIRKQVGRKETGRIFRDQEELPITADISETILRALDEAEFLILICSTHTSESQWVQREIDYFLKHHDRHHILTVLADGEPDDVIPETVLKDERTITAPDGTRTVEITNIEPLSCDYRKKRRDARREEIPRLAAAILGVSYDLLINRQHRWRMQRLAFFMTAVLAVTAVFLGYFIYSNRKISQNYRQALHNQSMYLTTEARRLYSNYQYAESMALALHAVPESVSEQNKLPELYSLLFELSEAYVNPFTTTIFNEKMTLAADRPIAVTQVFEDERRIILVDRAGTVYLIDSTSGKLILKKVFSDIETNTFSKISAVPYGEDKCLIKYFDSDESQWIVLCLELSDGTLCWERTHDGDGQLEVLDDGSEFPDYILGSGPSVVDGRSGTVTGYGSSSYYFVSALDGKKVFLAGYKINITEDAPEVCLWDTADNTVTPVALPEEMNQYEVCEAVKAEDGSLLVMGESVSSFRKYVLAKILPDGTADWVCVPDEEFGSDIFMRIIPSDEHSEEDSDLPSSGILLAGKNHLLVIDAENGEISKEIQVYADGATSSLEDVCFSSGPGYIWMLSDDGSISSVNLSTGWTTSWLDMDLDVYSGRIFADDNSSVGDRGYGLPQLQVLLYRNNRVMLYGYKYGTGIGDNNRTVVSTSEEDWEGTVAASCESSGYLYLLRSDGMLSCIETASDTVIWTSQTEEADISYNIKMSCPGDGSFIFIFIEHESVIEAVRSSDGKRVPLSLSDSEDESADFLLVNEYLIAWNDISADSVFSWNLSEAAKKGKAARVAASDDSGLPIRGTVLAADPDRQNVLLSDKQNKRYLIWNLSDGKIRAVKMPESLSYSDTTLGADYSYYAVDEITGKMVVQLSGTTARLSLAVIDGSSGDALKLDDSGSGIGEYEGVVCCAGQAFVLTENAVYRFDLETGKYLGMMEEVNVIDPSCVTEINLENHHVLLKIGSGYFASNVLLDTSEWKVMANISGIYADGRFWYVGQTDSAGTRGLYTLPLYTMDELASKVRERFDSGEYRGLNLEQYGIEGDVN